MYYEIILSYPHSDITYVVSAAWNPSFISSYLIDILQIVYFGNKQGLVFIVFHALLLDRQTSCCRLHRDVDWRIHCIGQVFRYLSYLYAGYELCLIVSADVPAPDRVINKYSAIKTILILSIHDVIMLNTCIELLLAFLFSGLGRWMQKVFLYCNHNDKEYIIRMHTKIMSKSN